ncbi:MAG: PKD domain-containing protein [Bacteroidota bacterium]
MKIIRNVALFIFLISLIFIFYITQNSESKIPSLASIENIEKPTVRSSFSSKNREDVQERFEYEFARLKDPVSNKIPSNIRTKELNFAKKLPNKMDLNKTANKVVLESWVQRGPINVGGRTRALAIDLDYNGSSNKRILAGGVSGGMFLSEDDGLTWERTTSNSQLPSVTCLAQDPTNKNVWYYGTGEFTGNSASSGGLYLGEGIFKSTDGGNSWTQLTSTYQGSKLTVFDNYLDIIWNIAVHPQNGAVYAATYGAILLSTNGGTSWAEALVGQAASGYSERTDVVIASNDDVYAALSKNGIGLNSGEYGIFRSTNGTDFVNINPAGLSSDPYRIVLGTAPSDANTLYVLVQANQNGSVATDHQLFKYNSGSNSWVNLSANLPHEDGVDGNASFSSQGGYDLLVKVKPDNPDVIWIGGTNLYRSTNAGQSFTRVGGYKSAANYEGYENSHADFHSMTFYPNDPNSMINGHDGGLSKTNDVLEQPQNWTLLNQTYVTSQFYALAIDPQAGNDNLIIGGLQDNGSWATESTSYEDNWFDMLGGDGGYAAVAPGAQNMYVSSQLGFVVRYSYQNNQWLSSVVQPNAQNFQFIAPYVLDPNNANVMYIAAGNAVWRNSDLSGISHNNYNATSVNWSELNNSAVVNTAVTTLSISKQPANRLYFGATDNQSNTYIVRVDNAQNNPSGTDITPSGITGGSYPSYVGINSNDADEILVTFSNYNVPSIWHSSNGGANWTNVEGNLGGENGPSVRCATIMPDGSYYLATSTGVYSTQTLSGSGTTWALEGADVIGNVVVDMLALRAEDGFMVAGTHGRGVYSTKVGSGSAARAVTDKQSLTLRARPGESGSTTFTLSNTGGSTLNFNISVSGDLILAKQTSSNIVLKKTTSNRNLFDKIKNDGTQSTTYLKFVENKNKTKLTKETNILGDDVWILDDGDASADQFLGWEDGTDLYWYNEFNLSGFDFQLDEIQFFMRTESASSNSIYLAVYDQSATVVSEGYIDYNTSTNGTWFSATLDPALDFSDGESFYIEVGTDGTGIPYPAGIDVDATVKDKTFYWDGETWQNLNTISGFENGAALIRAVGTASTTANQNPVAVANVNPTQANVNDMITFDGSGSYDNDGNIASYLWNFGDGATSTQQTAQHSYSQANTYNYSLTVTDDGGATNQATGQVTISQSSSSKVTVVPSSGTVNTGGSQLITLTLDATTVTAGTYIGQVNISTNGGNITIPIDYVVDVEKDNTLPDEYSLSQNYPNPFNPSTTIEFAIPQSDEVTLIVYDMLGREVAELVNDKLSAGNHKVQFNAAAELSSGVYIYRLKTSSYTNTKKLILIK